MPASLAVIGLGTAAVKTAADFDSAMAQVAAVSGATGDDLQALRDKAREMGEKTKFSASEAASAMNYMAMAGWKTEDMLSGIDGIMSLAAASGEDLATTSDIVTDALTAFGLTAKDSGHFADILAAASSNVHQQKAFERLTGSDGRSTLIATGTGSGKTECFLYPILEYCYQHRGEKGIKAIIIYPMNALATDQAGRIAKLIYGSPELNGNVTVGMYVGGFDSASGRVMGEDSVITDRETMRSAPPDILMTNYKMLDYLLVRPGDAPLWEDNRPDTLKYIAVDELHVLNPHMRLRTSIKTCCVLLEKKALYARPF